MTAAETMRLVHYSASPVAKVRSTPRARQKAGFKPTGFWVSVEGNADGWYEWCVSEQFRPGWLAVAHHVELKPRPYPDAARRR